MSTSYPNIDRWLDPWIRQLSAFPKEEYAVLRDELGDASQYREQLVLLDQHLDLASSTCTDFSRLISEHRNLGSDLDNANRQVLDKLSEIRAVVGLNEAGFTDIAFCGTPDLQAKSSGTTFAVEVTRISASGGPNEPPQGIEVTLIKEGDQDDELFRQIITKALAKRDQLLNAGRASDHFLWVSTGRDYFTAGRYEPKNAGLRPGMPRHLEAMARTACSDSRIRDGYPELVYLGVSPGRDKKPLILKVQHGP